MAHSFQVGQKVLIRGAELDGVVGTIVSLAPSSANLQIANQVGSGSAVTNVRFECLEAVPPANEVWPPGAEVSFYAAAEDRWCDAVVMGSGVIHGVPHVLLEYSDGAWGWVQQKGVRARLSVPAFETVADADAWVDEQLRHPPLVGENARSRRTTR